MIERFLDGVGVAVVTPFLENGEVDYDSLQRLVNFQIDEGVQYLLALGTTSESPTLTEPEKTAVVRTIVETAGGRVPVIMGFGGPSTHELLSKFKTTDFTGISALLSVTPYYNRPSQEGLYQHYKALAEKSPLPIILYNVRSRTACNIEAETTLKLAHDCPNIVAIKEASGNINQIMRVIKHAPAGFSVISGDDAITLPLIAAGACGVISVVANAFPKTMSEMVHLALENRFAEARALHLKLLDITQSCFKEGNPAGIKSYLALQGRIQNRLRLPLTPASTELQQTMQTLLKNFC